MRRRLLSAINKFFKESLEFETENEVIQKCLEVVENLTGSEFGFYGEITNGNLDICALSVPNTEINEITETSEFLKIMEFSFDWRTFIKEEKSQIVNNPISCLDQIDFPEGHPTIQSFLGVPIKQGDKTIGLIVLANKRAGYNEKDRYNVEAISGAFVEVLMRKKAEIEIKENLKQLAESNKELEQFAYITSHDLREPLRMITSFLQLLERRYKNQLDQDANEFIEFAVNGAKRLDNMTNDLLSILSNYKPEKEKLLL